MSKKQQEQLRRDVRDLRIVMNGTIEAVRARYGWQPSNSGKPQQQS
ncbi:MAG: hypothetical protein KAJ19_11050 [Gammaproteobacteria bacterium]|nr:hypothetical protein [Gammaproteobacteria bacterium]